MSLESDYSGTYLDDEYLIPIFEGLAVHIDRHVQKLRGNLREEFANTDFDIEYIDLYIDTIGTEMLNTLYARIASLKQLSSEKLKDFD